MRTNPRDNEEDSASKVSGEGPSKEQDSPLLRVLRAHAEVLRLRLIKPSKIIIDTGDIENVEKAS